MIMIDRPLQKLHNISRMSARLPYRLRGHRLFHCRNMTSATIPSFITLMHQMDNAAGSSRDCWNEIPLILPRHCASWSRSRLTEQITLNNTPSALSRTKISFVFHENRPQSRKRTQRTKSANDRPAALVAGWAGMREHLHSLCSILRFGWSIFLSITIYTTMWVGTFANVPHSLLSSVLPFFVPPSPLYVLRDDVFHLWENGHVLCERGGENGRRLICSSLLTGA